MVAVTLLQAPCKSHNVQFSNRDARRSLLGETLIKDKIIIVSNKNDEANFLKELLGKAILYGTKNQYNYALHFPEYSC